MTLEDATIARAVTVQQVGGERGFRRRMMELGLLPGTVVELVRVAPLGDPIELKVRGSRLSIRRHEARCILVDAAASDETESRASGEAWPASNAAAVRGASS